MKTTLFAAIAVLGLALAAPAFAAEGHRDPVAAGARSNWQTNENAGAGVQVRLAATDSEGGGGSNPYAAEDDSDGYA